ncbi:hypothetical protein A0H81_03254 [Grifola frondosa]|uniref:Uncharacterized protein n=1 Tax=Grifola frondosa TaxID=5627 RepID=A0A1C7MI56_GRIFR|nr:hypothetical protein A0H81_03254 [Grifola frondosa]
MFSSVFSKQKVHRAITGITGIRRAPSPAPPSPASFASPEIVDINEKGVRNLQSSNAQWFPPTVLGTDNRTPPKRNVSLPNGNKNGSEGASSSRNRGGLNDSSDAVIVEEPETQQPAQLSVNTGQIQSSDDNSENGVVHIVRKPTPSPIKIPNNPTADKIQIQRSTTEDASTGPLLLPIAQEGSRPRTPESALTDDISSAVSGTTLAGALASSFVLSSESRSSRYKSGITRQDSATLPRGEHPFINSPYGYRSSSSTTGASSPATTRSSSVPPLPPMPSRGNFGQNIDSAAASGSHRKSVSLDPRDNVTLPDAESPSLRRPRSLSRLPKEQQVALPPISPISEASSPPPSVPNTPLMIPQNQLNSSSRSLVNSQRNASATEDSASVSGSSAGAAEGSMHRRAGTEPASSGDREKLTPNKPRSNSITKSTLSLANFERSGSPMPESNAARSSTTSRTTALLPIGERPSQSTLLQSPRLPSENDMRSKLSVPAAPASIRTSEDTPVDSPDLLDFMFPVAPTILTPVPSPQDTSSGDSLSSASTNRQTFPETPNAFSPWSAGFAVSPPPARTSLEHNVSRGAKIRQRATTVPRIPPTPPLTAEGAYGHSPQMNSAVLDSAMEDAPLAPRPLAAIEETRAVSYSSSPEPQSRRTSKISRSTDEAAESAYSREENRRSVTSAATSAADSGKAAQATPPLQLRAMPPDEPVARSPPSSYAPTFDLSSNAALSVTRSASESDVSLSMLSERRKSRPDPLDASRGAASHSSIPLKRSLSPLPSPPPSSVPLPPSPPPAVNARDSQIMLENPPPPYAENVRRPSPLSRPTDLGSISAPMPSPLLSHRAAYSESSSSPRPARVRPPLPAGPRKPSFGPAAARARAGSVSTTSGGSSSALKSSFFPMAMPRFQNTRVNFRGLTMEAAQWTFTSQQLQHLVSTAIKQSAEPSAIRILPVDTLNVALPEEVARLETLSADLRLRYKLGGEFSDQATTIRMLEELSEISDNLDFISEELYSVTDQLGQLTHLRDVHCRSALAMALRKLNSSFVKQVGEVQKLRDHVATLEAERDEAWKEAQEVAQEFDDFTDRIPTEQSSTMTSSRRSSRVLVARKNSQRASKAGLRASMHRRSQRSSISSSHRNSAAASASPNMRSSGFEDIPPVPPIPTRTPLGIVTADLPTRSSMESPTSDIER